MPARAGQGFPTTFHSYEFYLFQVMAELKPNVMLFGHSFVRRLSCRSERRGESVSQTLGLEGSCAMSSFGQGGLTFDKIVMDPGRYTQRILVGGQPDLLIVDVGSNHLGAVDTVAEVVDNTLRFLGMLDAHGISPQRILFMSVIQRTSRGRHGGVALRTYNHRVKAYNARLATCLTQYPHITVVSQTKIKHQKFFCRDGCHLTEERLTKYGFGVRQSVLNYLTSC